MIGRSAARLPACRSWLSSCCRWCVWAGLCWRKKGESGPAEAQASEQAIRLLGGRLRQLIKVDLPGVAEERYLVMIDKIAATPPNYPRRVGVPAKKPL